MPVRKRGGRVNVTSSTSPRKGRIGSQKGVGAPIPPPTDSFLLLENGDYLLQEDGTSKFLLEA